MISVLIVEDEPELLRRFSDAILTAPDLHLVGAVSSGSAAIAMLDVVAPHVVLVDLGLPDVNGVKVIEHAVAKHPTADVLVITMFGDDSHVLASISAGATGYLLKDMNMERIVASIREVHAGGSPISPSIARRLLARFRPAPELPDPVTSPLAQGSPLSTRETEILQLIAKGLSFAEVGDTLSISPHTVVTHVKRIYKKLSVHSKGEAVYEANQLGFI